MTILGKNIRLKGITQKGKNRVRDHGETWAVLAETDKVIFNPELGPWLFISPAGCDQFHKASRWIKRNNDFDFEVHMIN